MFWFKSKSKSEELLPPPPPFPAMEFEEEREKPVLFDEFVDTSNSKAETIPEVKEFDDLLKDFEKEPKAKSAASKKDRIIKQKKALISKKPKPLKKIILKQPKKALAKKAKEKKHVNLKTAKKFIQVPELEDFDLEDYGKEFDIEKDFGDFGFETKPEPEAKSKPREIIEAEQEIKDAIEKIKEREKPSFFNKLFAKKEKIEEKPKEIKEITLPKIPEVDDVSKIKNSISKARESLMSFDLEAAKKNYLEIMQTYNVMNPEEQAKVYNDIRDLYFERKSAEELKV